MSIHKKGKLAAFLILLFPSLCFSDVKMFLGDGIRIHALNGKVIKNESAFSSSQYLDIPDGKNQILISMVSEIKKGNSSELEYSDPSVVSFSVDSNNIFINAPRIKNMREFKKFSSEFNWIIVDTEGRKIQFDAQRLPVSGFRLGVDYEQELADFNRKDRYQPTIHRAAGVGEKESKSDKPMTCTCIDQERLISAFYILLEGASPETIEELRRLLNQ